jgi:ABC-type transport system involved in multi-copper enzyme maturation permease subunit
MSALVKKEIRLLLPAWIAAMLLAIVPVWIVWPGSDFIYDGPGPSYNLGAAVFAPFGFGVLLLALTPFGQELSLGTFSMLLAQPASRRRLWLVKTSLLAVALASAFVALCLSNHFRVESLLETTKDMFWRDDLNRPSVAKQLLNRIADFQQLALHDSLIIGGLSALAAFAGGLWTTLLFRQPGAAFWFALLVPMSLSLVPAWLTGGASRGIADAGLIATMGLYSAAGFFWAKRYFLRAQDTSWTGGSVPLPAWPGSRTRAAARGRATERKPLRALVRKEFQLQQINLLIAGLLLLSHLVTLAVRRLNADYFAIHRSAVMGLEELPLLWLAMPFLVGSSSVAEERKQGTLENLLCLPVTRRVQFAVKFGLALLLGIFLGALMPWLLEGALGPTSIRGVFLNWNEPDFWLDLSGFCLGCATITTIAFYASTLTRNLLQAMGATFVVSIALGSFVVWVIYKSLVPWNSPVLWHGPLAFFIGLPTLLGVLFRLAFNNFKCLHVGWSLWRRNLLLILGSMAFIVASTVLIWNRPWEFVMPLEPKHGPARLSGPLRPKICATRDGARIFALLPDGRLWATEKYELRLYGEHGHVFGEALNYGHYAPIPLDGAFIESSNWVDLAGSWNQVVGIQSDGSLWNLFEEPKMWPWDLTNYTGPAAFPKPKRIGMDSDWKTAAGAGGFFLALKNDGTLWGWGNNNNGQLGAGPMQFTNGPVRIGNESDWAAIYAALGSSVGVKHDGSVWKWGHLPEGPNGYDKDWKDDHPEPVRWNLDGSKWASFTGNDWFDVVLEKDGTLWAMGDIPMSLLGDNPPDRMQHTRFSAKPVRIGNDSDWSELTHKWVLLAGLKKNGALFERDFYYLHISFWGFEWNPSSYSDWIATGADDRSFLTLAADGTLCSWEDPDQQISRYSLLGPSRKPEWSLNIFAQSPAKPGSSGALRVNPNRPEAETLAQTTP